MKSNRTLDHTSWEERIYEPMWWAAVDSEAMTIHDSKESRQAFWKLFRYIQGANEDEVEIAMTTPVTFAITPGHGPNCESNFTMSFLIESKFQGNPPKPTEDDVYLHQNPEWHVAVRRFGGFASDEKYIEHTQEFYNDLAKNNVEIVEDPYYHVGYNSPYQLKNRRQEVWFTMKKQMSEEEAK